MGCKGHAQDEPAKHLCQEEDELCSGAYGLGKAGEASSAEGAGGVGFPRSRAAIAVLMLF